MKKPSFAIEEMGVGKIFQISPEGKNPINILYGGDFLVATKYTERGVSGYLASVLEREGTASVDGEVHVHIEWEFLELVGESFWYKQQKEDESGNS